MSKLTKYALLVFAVFLVATAPVTAAALAEDGWNLLGQLANGAAEMLGQLTD